MKDKHNTLSGIIGWLLLFWLIANFGPYLLVYVLSGQPFYQALPFQQSIIVEVALMSLNLGLPLWWLWQRNIPWREGLAWQWQGRRSWLWGLGGLAVVLIWGWLVTLLLPVSAADSGTGQSYPLSQAVPVLLGIIRWRTGSIASTAILHGILWWLVIFGFYGTAVSAIVGLILASSTFIYNVIKEKRAHGQGLREGSHEI